MFRKVSKSICLAKIQEGLRNLQVIISILWWTSAGAITVGGVALTITRGHSAPLTFWFWHGWATTAATNGYQAGYIPSADCYWLTCWFTCLSLFSVFGLRLWQFGLRPWFFLKSGCPKHLLPRDSTFNVTKKSWDLDFDVKNHIWTHMYIIVILLNIWIYLYIYRDISTILKVSPKSYMDQPMHSDVKLAPQKKNDCKCKCWNTSNSQSITWNGQTILREHSKLQWP